MVMVPKFQLTLFQQAGMSDAKFLADAEWVEQDLLTLKLLASLVALKF